ncbi:CpaF family protein [uncultured Marinobacter sp.]|uniref:CpaF family protein n=1 Tax=uncultured Marinobacter sp. TaxID=187379 RepID=UPI00263A2500|nr:CpaF family protein [uncultured Marinobacter sp.]
MELSKLNDAGKSELEPPLVTSANGMDSARRSEEEQERIWKQKIHQKLMKVLDLSLLGTLGREEAERQLQDIGQRLMSEESIPLSLAARQRILRQIQDDILGFGPLEPLLADKSISDILVNGYNCIYVERNGKLERENISFQSDTHLLNTIDRIVSSVGRRIDESSPMVDARLKDGSRVNAIIPPLAVDGPLLSIRRFSIGRLSMEALIEKGTLTAPIANLLEGIVRGRLNVLISGGTGSGKTTLLNVLSGFVPHDERIVTIEDSAELQLQQPHVARLETRPPNIENKGEVTQRDLVRNSLRMRPDRIIVGEVRGTEALDMLQAMNTGHDGSMTTLHANAPRDALTRIENMVSMTGTTMPTKAVRSQIASAIEVVLQVERQEDGTRRLVSVQEINGMEGDVITMSEIFTFRRLGRDEQGRVLGNYRATGIVPRFQEHLQQRGIALPLSLYDPDFEG